MNEISWLVLITLILGLLVGFWLAGRQVQFVRAHRGAVPDAFADKIPLDAHQKAADYTIAKVHFGIASALFSAALLVIWTFGGGLDLLDNGWRQADQQSHEQGSL